MDMTIPAAVIITGVIGLLATIASSLIVFVVTRGRFDAKMAERLTQKEKELAEEIEQLNKFTEQRLHNFRTGIESELEKIRRAHQEAMNGVSEKYIERGQCKLRHKELESCLSQVKQGMDQIIKKMDELSVDMTRFRRQEQKGQAMLLASIQAMDIEPDKKEKLMEQFGSIIKEDNGHH